MLNEVKHLASIDNVARFFASLRMTTARDFEQSGPLAGRQTTMTLKRIGIWLQQALYRVPSTDTHCWETKLELLRLSRESQSANPPVQPPMPERPDAPVTPDPLEHGPSPQLSH
jgi:hypothetical protein